MEKCELEMKTPFKKDEKYRHTEDCKEQARGICDQCKRKSLKPVYAMQDMLVCTYEPKESRAMASTLLKDTAKVFLGKKATHEVCGKVESKFEVESRFQEEDFSDT